MATSSGLIQSEAWKNGCKQLTGPLVINNFQQLPDISVIE